MLEGLDVIGWRDLTHAYGSAGDIPTTLRNLTSLDDVVRGHAQNHLYSTIYHQGTVYEATAFAVPFLLELAGSASVPERDWILDFLSAFAEETEFAQLNDLKAHQEFVDAASNDEREQRIRQGIIWASRVREAVRSGLSLYLRLLDDDVAAIRAAASRSLAYLPEDAAVSIPALRRRLDAEEDEDVRLQLLESVETVLSDEDDSEEDA